MHLHALSLRSASSRTITLQVAGVSAAGGVTGEWTDTTTGVATVMAAVGRSCHWLIPSLGLGPLLNVAYLDSHLSA